MGEVEWMVEIAAFLHNLEGEVGHILVPVSLPFVAAAGEGLVN